MKNISAHITYAEAVKSETAIRKGIPNVPGSAELKAMQHVAAVCFEPLRNHFKVPIPITSFYRSKRLNAAIGGSPTSQHCSGEAIDIDMDRSPASNVTNGAVFRWLKGFTQYDQLIWEFGNDDNPDWVHVSTRADGENRGQVLRAIKVKGRTHYVPFK